MKEKLFFIAFFISPKPILQEYTQKSLNPQKKAKKVLNFFLKKQKYDYFSPLPPATWNMMYIQYTGVTTTHQPPS